MCATQINPSLPVKSRFFGFSNPFAMFYRRSHRKVIRHIENMPDYLLKDIGLCGPNGEVDRDIMTLNANIRAGVLPNRSG